MATILIINGPNLNLLGKREIKHYGLQSLQAINTHLVETGNHLGHTVHCFQSNAEHELINRIHTASHDETDFIIINPAAFTHTSIALRDALLAVSIPFIEIHLSNIYARESFRQQSYFSDIALGVITGLGSQGYDLALRAALHYLEKSK
jgi:3-dehydroquinate dehydratase-2